MLKLGVIGFSPGNGHPFSWSAIFNGYQPELIDECGYPTIGQYLSKEDFPEAQLGTAVVTHAWSQDFGRSQFLARCCHIGTVAKSLPEMVESVDAVLLARDDAENHFDLARLFLEFGIPVFVDKPFALSRSEGRKIYEAGASPALVYSTAATAHASELRLTPDQEATVGRIEYVECLVPNSWDQYSIHAIDPLLNILNTSVVGETRRTVAGSSNILDVEFFDPQVSCRIVATGKRDTPIGIRIWGTEGSAELKFTDTFKAFRASLAEFVEIAAGRLPPQAPEHVLRRIDLVEAGRGQ